jgi:hypothetical protein
MTSGPAARDVKRSEVRVTYHPQRSAVIICRDARHEIYTVAIAITCLVQVVSLGPPRRPGLVLLVVFDSNSTY